jgi:hypothetical protein
MLITSLDHYLDAKGTIALESGPGRKMAEFMTAAVAYASNRHRPANALTPSCFKCRNPKSSVIDVGMTDAGLVIWRCHTCGSEGQISNWRGSFWDLS